MLSTLGESKWWFQGGSDHAKFSIYKEMMVDKKRPNIKVQCYSGYKADEKPISFILDGKKLMVERVIDQWLSPEFEYFKVLADDEKVYLLRNDERNDDWALEKIFKL